MKIDWSKAPDWANWAVLLDGFFSHWERFEMDSDPNLEYIPRPTQWKGPQDGFPPDDTECEISNCGSDFEWCLIKYMGTHLCVVDHKTHHDQHYHLGSVDFRPIQSERDKSIAELEETIYKNHWVGMPTPKGIAQTVWDLGWRKPMSREEANAVISEAMLDIPISVRHRTSLLDALGY